MQHERVNFDKVTVLISYNEQAVFIDGEEYSYGKKNLFKIDAITRKLIIPQSLMPSKHKDMVGKAIYNVKLSCQYCNQKIEQQPYYVKYSNDNGLEPGTEVCNNCSGMIDSQYFKVDNKYSLRIINQGISTSLSRRVILKIVDETTGEVAQPEISYDLLLDNNIDYVDWSLAPNKLSQELEKVLSCNDTDLVLKNLNICKFTTGSESTSIIMAQIPHIVPFMQYIISDNNWTLESYIERYYNSYVIHIDQMPLVDSLVKNYGIDKTYASNSFMSVIKALLFGTPVPDEILLKDIIIFLDIVSYLGLDDSVFYRAFDVLCYNKWYTNAYYYQMHENQDELNVIKYYSKYLKYSSKYILNINE